MATITSLPAAGALDGSEVIAADQAGVTSKATSSQIKTYALTSPVVTGVLSVPAGTAANNAIQFNGVAGLGLFASNGTTLVAGNSLASISASSTAITAGSLYSTGYLRFGTNAALYDGSARAVIISTAPTIASGFGTAPALVGSNTAAFKVTVGTGGAASGILTFPAATTGWAVHCTDVTNVSTVVAVAFSTSTTSVTVQAYSRTNGLASTFAAGDVLEFSALCY